MIDITKSTSIFLIPAITVMKRAIAYNREERRNSALNKHVKGQGNVSAEVLSSIYLVTFGVVFV